tara:strand:+ start:262 stop:954 length:693 start_codon:yes stop_codon:yes gene_type:complete
MAKFEKRTEAYKLRRSGKSINEIAKTLGVSKSTVSLWCRGLQLTQKQELDLKKKMIAAGHAGRIAGANAMRKQKQLRIAKAQQQATRLLGEMSSRERLFLGLGLYWGEGVKTDQSTTSFVNADPQSVHFMKCWFMEFFDVLEDQFNPYIFIAESHKGREEVIKKFWATALQLPTYQFRKCIYLKQQHKKKYDNHGTYYGTLALRIKRSTNIRYQILSMLEQTKNSSKKDW